MPKQPTYTHSFPFPLHELKPGESAVEKFDTLAENQVFVRYGHGDDNPLLLYVAYMGYGSGLHKAVPDWRERKKVAADLAGIKASDPRRESVLNLTHEGVQAMRVEWIRLFCPMEFAEFDTLIEFYYQTLTEISKAKTASAGKDLATEYKSWMALSDDLAGLRGNIRALATKLFSGDEELRAIAEKARPKPKGGIEALVLGR